MLYVVVMIVAMCWWHSWRSWRWMLEYLGDMRVSVDGCFRGVAFVVVFVMA